MKSVEELKQEYEENDSVDVVVWWQSLKLQAEAQSRRASVLANKIPVKKVAVAKMFLDLPSTSGGEQFSFINMMAAPP